MGFSNKQILTTAIVILIILVGFLFYFFKTLPNEVKMINETQLPQVRTLCPPSGFTGGQAKYEDELASSTTYKTDSDVWFVSSSINASINNVQANTLSLTDWSSSVDLECSHQYKTVALTAADKTTSVVDVDFYASGPVTRHRLLGASIRQLEVKIKDLLSDEFMDITNSEDTDNSNYQQLDNDLTNITDSGSFTSFTINSDDWIDIELQIRTNDTKTLYGEEGLDTFLCVDSNKDKWEEPLISAGENLGINILLDEFDDMRSNDKKALNGYEYCYEIGQLTSTFKTFNYYQETKTGVNPAAADSPKLWFISEGRYLSDKDVDSKGDKAINIGAFKDDVDFTLVSTVNPQRIQLVVS